MSNRILASRYRLESEVGRGGMGVVYRATDTEVKRTVAVKTLPAVMSHNQDLMRRFASEVSHASRLEHPNIVRVYDVGEDSGTNFYVMQYIDGSDLRSQIKSRGRFAIDDAIAIVSQVADALDYAHEQGIVHRDVKPENVLIDAGGAAHIADFGIAKAVEGTRTTQGILGTPEYMSPEQVKGRSLDGRSDEYSLAVMAYEMIVGRTPFKTEGDDPWAQINMHINTPVPNPRTTAPDIPTHVSNALLQALAKEPDQRFASCSEFVKALKGEIEAKVPKEVVSKPGLFAGRRKLAWCAGVVLAVSLAALGLFCLTRHRQHLATLVASAASGVRPVIKIAYVDEAGSVPILYFMNPDGGEKQTITRLPSAECFISADGGKVVYGDKGGVNVLLRQTGATQRAEVDVQPASHVVVLGVNKDATVALCSICPDNSDQGDQTYSNVFVVDLVGKHKTALGLANSQVLSAALSSDGSCVVVRTLGGVLWIFDINGALKCKIEDAGRYKLHPKDPTILCGVADELVGYDYSGKEISRVKIGGGQIGDFCLTPDCKSLIAAVDEGIVALDTTGGQRRLLQKIGDGSGGALVSLALSPNGQKLIYTTGVCEGSTVWMETGGVINLADGSCVRLDFERAIVANCKHGLEYHRRLRPYATEQWPKDYWDFGSEPAVCPDGERALIYLKVEDEGNCLYCADLVTGELKEIQRFADGVRGSSISWVSDTVQASQPSPQRQGEESSSVVGLPQGFVLKGNQTADFDGDGSLETVYYAMDQGQGALAMWLVKNGQVIWRQNQEKGDRSRQMQMIDFRPCHISDQKASDLVISYSWLHAGGFQRFVTCLLRWHNGSFEALLPEKVQIGSNEYTLDDRNYYGEAVASRVFFSKIGTCVLVVQSGDNAVVAAEYVWQGQGLAMKRQTARQGSLDNPDPVRDAIFESWR